MIAAAPATPPAILAPAPHQVSFGRIVARLPAGTVRVVVSVDGRRKLSRRARPGRRRIWVSLPSRDATIRVIAVDRRGLEHRSARVGPVFGLPAKSAPRAARAWLDPSLEGRVTRLLREFGPTAGAYVRSLTTGAGAAWNAGARFPAASTLKLAIAVEALRSLRGPPASGSSADALLHAMLVVSDNRAANALEVLIGGSTSGGSARVDALMRSLGLVDTEMYGGYEIEDARLAAARPAAPARLAMAGRAADGLRPAAEARRARRARNFPGGAGARRTRPIPVRVESQPSFGRGKYSTPADLARLLRAVYLAAGGRGPLVERGFTPAEARYLLFLLVHVQDGGKLDRFLPRSVTVAHKAGWISTARHDNGVVFWPGGAFVVCVMTWRPAGAGLASDVLAGRVARVSLARFEQLGSRRARRG